MIEEYLHFIWAKKRVPIVNLKTTDGTDLQISNFGKFNRINSGPDFSMGAVVLDEVELHGPIEMHVKSSDWYRHKHDLDKAYNNVILHVVYEHDKEVVQNNWKIPTLELKGKIDYSHFIAYKKKSLNVNDLVCDGKFKVNVNDEFEKMKRVAYELKLDLKCKEFFSQFVVNPSDVFYQLLARAFGVGANKRSFQMLSKRVNFQELIGLPYAKVYKMFFFESGLVLNEKTNNDFKWDYCGTRPANFPERRMMQLSQFLVGYKFNLAMFQNNNVFIINHLKDFLRDTYFTTSNKERKPSKVFYSHLIINVFAPILYMNLLSDNGSKSYGQVVDLLICLPVERNSITEKYKGNEVAIKNAYDSQAVLSLYENYCSQKKCLSCAVGEKILRN